jgi:predicted NUDIX family NTP pyrophosphohydrolase
MFLSRNMAFAILSVVFLRVFESFSSIKNQELVGFKSLRFLFFLMRKGKIKNSAGMLMFTRNKTEIKVFLAHHGGPEWEAHDTGAWDLPKGQIEEGEKDLLEVAKREFFEETGIKPFGKFMELGSTFNKWGKEIFIWAFEGKGDEKFISSNTFEMEYPKGSGKIMSFPEMDKGEYLRLKEVKIKGHSYIQVFIERLIEKLDSASKQKKLF